MKSIIYIVGVVLLGAALCCVLCVHESVTGIWWLNAACLAAEFVLAMALFLFALVGPADDYSSDMHILGP